VRQTGYIRAAAQPFDIGMAAHHAAGGAGHIGENPVERPAIPPFIRLGGIPDQQLRGQFQTLQIFCDALQAFLVFVDRHHFYLCAFQHMRGLAARCGAGIQHAHTVVNIQQTRGVLRAGILHRNQPAKEPGSLSPAPVFPVAARPARSGARADLAAPASPDNPLSSRAAD